MAVLKTVEDNVSVATYNVFDLLSGSSSLRIALVFVPFKYLKRRKDSITLGLWVVTRRRDIENSYLVGCIKFNVKEAADSKTAQWSI